MGKAVEQVEEDGRLARGEVEGEGRDRRSGNRYSSGFDSSHGSAPPRFLFYLSQPAQLRCCENWMHQRAPSFAPAPAPTPACNHLRHSSQHTVQSIRSGYLESSARSPVSTCTTLSAQSEGLNTGRWIM